MLPIVLYACWVAVAVWDISRGEDRTTGWKLGWLAAVLLVPGPGSVGYYAFGGAAIPCVQLLALVVGGSGPYLTLGGASLFASTL